MPNYYSDLGLERSATEAEVKSAYKVLAAKYHPDNKQTGDAEKFRRVREAYAVLSDPAQRGKYDEHGYVDPEELAQLLADLGDDVRTAREAFASGQYLRAAAYGSRGLGRMFELVRKGQQALKKEG